MNANGTISEATKSYFVWGMTDEEIDRGQLMLVPHDDIKRRLKFDLPSIVPITGVSEVDSEKYPAFVLKIDTNNKFRKVGHLAISSEKTRMYGDCNKKIELTDDKNKEPLKFHYENNYLRLDHPTLKNLALEVDLNYKKNNTDTNLYLFFNNKSINQEFVRNSNNTISPRHIKDHVLGIKENKQFSLVHALDFERRLVFDLPDYVPINGRISDQKKLGYFPLQLKGTNKYLVYNRDREQSCDSKDHDFIFLFPQVKEVTDLNKAIWVTYDFPYLKTAANENFVFSYDSEVLIMKN